MQIKVFDNMQTNVLGIMNNNIPDALHYYDDEFHEYLMNGSYAFSFSVYKYKDDKINTDIDMLRVGNHLSFKNGDDGRMMKIFSLTENITSISFMCMDVTLELISEDVPKYIANTSNSLATYFQMFGLQFGNIMIGINEVVGYTRKLAWDSSQTKLERLLSIVSQFDAECEFKYEFYSTGSLKNIIVNIYKKNNGKDIQGVGQDRTDVVLKVGKDIENITRKVDMSNLFTAIRATGKDGLTVNGISLSEKNEDGVEEFYLRYGEQTAFAPLARNLFPANIANAGTNGDTWVRRDFETEYTTVAELGAYMMQTLKKYAYPLVEYTVDLSSNSYWKSYNLHVGDTIKIIDMKFGTEPLLLKVRVKEISSSLSNNKIGKLVLSNFVELKSKVSSDMYILMDKLINDKTPYLSTISSTGSTMFKELTDKNELSVSLSKGNESITQDATITYKWYKNDILINTDSTLLVNYNDLDKDTNLIIVDIFKDDLKISSSQISLSKISDGISPINLFIKSSNGYQFKNNVINTTFTAILYQNNKEIDSDSTKFSYVWTKTNSDGTADIAWNLAHQSSQKSITISNSDVSQRATFNCTAEPLS